MLAVNEAQRRGEQLVQHRIDPVFTISQECVTHPQRDEANLDPRGEGPLSR